MEIIPDPLHVVALAMPFLVTMAGLYVILFKPMLAYLDEREAQSHAARKEVHVLSAQVEEHLEKQKSHKKAALHAAAELRADARSRALIQEAAILKEARQRSDATLQEALEEIRGEAAVASKALKEAAKELSTDMASQVLGRPIA